MDGVAAGNGIRKRWRLNRFGAQWWRRLRLPRRGKKDSRLTPGPLSEAQSDRLRERELDLLDSIKVPRLTRVKHLARAEWDPDRHVAVVRTARGNTMHSMGEFRNKRQELWPEEILFLVDKGSVELEIDGLPMSVQRTWATCFSAPNSLSVEDYLAFAYLRRAGYAVRRYVGPEVRGIRVTLSAWRSGGYKRREDCRPLFHLAVYTYDDEVARISDVAAFLDGCEKTRLRIAVVDRGVVIFSDVATNATPLSDRFVRRLPEGEVRIARDLRDGHASEFVPADVLADWNEPPSATIDTGPQLKYNSHGDGANASTPLPPKVAETDA